MSEQDARERARRIVAEVLADHERADRAPDPAVEPDPDPAVEPDPDPAVEPASLTDPGSGPVSDPDPDRVAASAHAPVDDGSTAVAQRLVDEVLLARGGDPERSGSVMAEQDPPASGLQEPEPDLFSAAYRAAEDQDRSVLEAVVPSDSWSTPWDDAPPEVILRPEPPEPVRAGRWLLATVVAAVAIAYLLPLAIAALRDLASLSG